MGFGWFDNIFLVCLAEMFLDRLDAVEAHWFGQIEADVLGFPALVFDPFFDDFLIANNFYTRFVNVKRHARKPLDMKCAQLILVIVMIGRAENNPADAALSDESVFALGRFGGSAFSLIKGSKMLFQDMSNSFVLGEPKRIIESTNEQRLDGLAFGIFLNIEDNREPVRPLQDHLGNFEQRIGAASHANLSGERLDAFIVGQQSHAQVWQGRRRFTTFALVAVIMLPSASTWPFAPRTVATFVWRTARPTFTALVRTPWAVASPAFPRWSSAIPSRAAAIIPTAFEAILPAFVFGVKICRSWFLCPCGQE